MTAAVSPLSERARLLFSGGALNAVMRECAEFAADAWIATYLPKRFQRAYAVALGYRSSQKRGPVGAEGPEGLTYDDRKRMYQGHDDPLVWTGKLREAVWRNVNVLAVATKGNARADIRMGQLNVTGKHRGEPAVRQLPAASIVPAVLTALPPHEAEFLTEQAFAVLADRLAATGAPAKTRRSLGPAPPAVQDRQRAAYAQQRALGDAASSARASIGGIMRDRYLRTEERWERWRNTPGGSAPIASILGRVMTAEERRLAHNSQARQSYQRRKDDILARRRARRHVAGHLAALRHRLSRPT